MKSKRDPRIDAYIAQAADFAQPILRTVREWVHEACPAATETIKWRMPHFEQDGRVLCGVAAFKAHCTFGFWHQQMRQFVATDSGKAYTAMGQFGRITSLADLPNKKTMLRYLKHAAKLSESDTPSRPKPKAKKPLPVPPELTAALKKNKAAATVFENFSPSHRREYIEWIADAKRDETRQKRLATTIEWLNTGKSRNWKYENC